uniref:Uncharacterized protein n=1 Tax=Clastoptera arizonana TaxID=38151 RepID=A0A1B6C492_9HEMI
MEPLAGKFSLNVITLFNSSLDAITPGMAYSSIVIFQSATKSTDDIKLKLAAATTGTTGSYSSIIMLTGSLSPDKMFFTWTGQAWVNFPLPATPSLGFVLGEKNIMKSSSVRIKQLLVNSNLKTAGAKKTVGVKVTSCNILRDIDGNLTSLFAGSIPINIPVDKLSTGPNDVINVEWVAVTVSPQLTGNFSIPIASDNPNFTVEWITGTFSFNLTTLFFTTLDVIQPGVKYSTSILLQDKSKPKPKSISSGSLAQLIMDSDEVDGYQLGTISLNGAFTPDNMYFTWNGEAWINFKPTNVSLNAAKNTLELKSDFNEINKCGGAVAAGKIKGNSFSGPQTYWSGDIPAAIPVSSFYPTYGKQLGILWTTYYSTDTTIKGVFYFPKPIYKDVMWLTGDYEFQLRPLWNCTLTDLIHSGVKYHSRINFQEYPLVTTVWTGEDFNKAQNTSITLQGSFSQDKSTFFWSGNFILDFDVKP